MVDSLRSTDIAAAATTTSGESCTAARTGARAAPDREADTADAGADTGGTDTGGRGRGGGHGGHGGGRGGGRHHQEQQQAQPLLRVRGDQPPQCLRTRLPARGRSPEGGAGHPSDRARPRRPRGRARAVRDAGEEAAPHRVHAPHRRSLHDQATG